MNDNLIYEKNLLKNGIKFIAGIDEVGRGPLVGPVVAACVIMKPDFYDARIKDSKKLSEKKRNELFKVITDNSISIGIGVVDNEIIDIINIYEATKKAMIEAINNMSISPEHILIDAMKLDIDIPYTSIIHGDDVSFTISCASIIAKVTRDKMMYELDNKYPMYDFKNNKGYGTKKHLDAIEKYGIIKEHRKSYAPIGNKRG